MKSHINVRNVVVALVVLGLTLLPVYSALSGNIFILTLFTRIVIFALAAASLNLIMGYGGMMSFGHAAYLGIGGYAVGHPRVRRHRLRLHPVAGSTGGVGAVCARDRCARRCAPAASISS